MRAGTPVAYETSREGAGLLHLLNEADQALRHGHGALDDTRVRALRSIELAGRRGLSQVRLAKTLGLSAPAVSKLIDSLERQGLVERRFDPIDRRHRLLHLADPGKAQLVACGQALDLTAGSVLGGMSDDEVSQLLRLLRKLSSNALGLNRCAGACADCAIGGC